MLEFIICFNAGMLQFEDLVSMAQSEEAGCSILLLFNPSQNWALKVKNKWQKHTFNKDAEHWKSKE